MRRDRGDASRARLAALPEREQYAALELWRGTMTTHSAIVRHRAASEGGIEVHFDADRWQRYVPIRRPWTRLIQERLPTGAAGALLNQSHQFRDLVLFIDAPTKRLFDAIDGHRSIADIVRDAGGIGDDRARMFFEALWRHDQVVFDASNAGDAL